MPMTVITIQNASSALRGDLTKWMQEIATGVYVGNFNSKIREELWSRVKKNIKHGQATLSYHYRNEIGYKFDIYQIDRQIIEYDGLQLIGTFKNSQINQEGKKGYSKAYKFRKSRQFFPAKNLVNQKNIRCVFLDIETTGLNCMKDKIIEIGAIKVDGDKVETFDMLVKHSNKIPELIKNLTGITDDMLQNNGICIIDALELLVHFIEDFSIVGYNISFDIDFINNQLSLIGKKPINNKSYDIMRYVKQKKMFLDNYKLSTVLKEYEIDKEVPHRAFQDARLLYELSTKVNGFLDTIK